MQLSKHEKIIRFNKYEKVIKLETGDLSIKTVPSDNFYIHLKTWEGTGKSRVKITEGV